MSKGRQNILTLRETSRQTSNYTAIHTNRLTGGHTSRYSRRHTSTNTGIYTPWYIGKMMEIYSPI